MPALVTNSSSTSRDSSAAADHHIMVSSSSSYSTGAAVADDDDDNEQQQHPIASTSIEFDKDMRLVSRLSSMPVVSDSLEYLNTHYNDAKKHSEYVKKGLEVVESTLSTVGSKLSETALPLTSLGAIDRYGCNILDHLEQNYPIVKQPATDMYDEATKILAEKRSAIAKGIDSGKTAILDSVEGSLSKMETVLGTDSDAVNTTEEGTDVVPGDKTKVERVINLSGKAYHAMQAGLLTTLTSPQASLPDINFGMNVLQFTQDYLNEHAAIMRAYLGPLVEDGVKKAEIVTSPYLHQVPKSMAELQERLMHLREKINTRALLSYLPSVIPEGASSLSAAITDFSQRMANEDPTDAALVQHGRYLLRQIVVVVKRLQDIKEATFPEAIQPTPDDTLYELSTFNNAEESNHAGASDVNMTPTKASPYGTKDMETPRKMFRLSDDFDGESDEEGINSLD